MRNSEESSTTKPALFFFFSPPSPLLQERGREAGRGRGGPVQPARVWCEFCFVFTSTSAIGIRNFGAGREEFRFGGGGLKTPLPLGRVVAKIVCAFLVRHFSAIRGMPLFLLLSFWMVVGAGIIRFRLFWGDGASSFFLRLVFPSRPPWSLWMGCWVAGKDGFCDLANLLGLGCASLRALGVIS
ncbi:hypothetical protein BJX76DRAFT_184093 [Aspergillus varians]